MRRTLAHWIATVQGLWRRRLSARLIAIAAASTIGLMAVGWGAQQQFSRQLLRILIDPEIESVSEHLIRNAGPGLAGEIILRDIPFDPRYVRAASGRYYQIAHIDAQGRLDVQVVSRSLYDVAIPLPEPAMTLIADTKADGAPHFIDIPQGPDGEPLRAVVQVVQIPDIEGRTVFVVAVATRAIIAPAVQLVGAAFAAFVAFCAAMVAGVTFLQVRVGLEPLRRLRRDIADVRKGQSERLGDDYAIELAPVAQELNALIDHNREVVERARRHVGNLAHALKTPIAVLKNAAHAPDIDRTVLRQSVEEMEGFVERQLRRARVAARAEASAGASAGAIGYRTPVLENLNDLVFMMEQKYDHEKALDISIEAEGDVVFRGEREDFLEMAANLIDNACKYGRSRVIVRVLPAFESNGLFEVVVEDDGPGLSEAEAAQALARGTRLDEAMPGQGLGLSILAETVELYAGELVFERAGLGGLKARLRLPATD